MARSKDANPQKKMASGKSMRSMQLAKLSKHRVTSVREFRFCSEPFDNF